MNIKSHYIDVDKMRIISKLDIVHTRAMNEHFSYIQSVW